MSMHTTRAQLTHITIRAVLCFTLLLSFASVTRADVAPPEMPPGSAVGPDDESPIQTQVQMRSERVVMDVVRVNPTDYASFAFNVAMANVTGTFTLRNLGTADETMQVRFPLRDPYGEGLGTYLYPDVLSFTVSVDGVAVPTKVIVTANPQEYTGSDTNIRWAAWDTTFPVGADVVISVSYVIFPTGYVPLAKFAYVLSTGAGWRGPIGRGEVVLRLPYPANTDNVIFKPSWSLGQARTTRGARFAGNEVRWSFRNLEPTKENDIIAVILAPNIWQGILDARAASRRSPRDADVWFALAQAYRRAVSYKYVAEGGERFIRQSEQAMQRAVNLRPDDAALHIELADLLFYFHWNEIDEQPDSAMARRIRRELETALKLDPGNERALGLLNQLLPSRPPAPQG